MTDLEILELSSVPETEYVREYNRQSAYNKKRISIMRPKDKRRSLAGLILLRKKIAERYGVTDYEFTYNQNGKPLLEFCCFSISHSGEYVACALDDTPVGVDTEVIRDIRDHKLRFRDPVTLVILKIVVIKLRFRSFLAILNVNTFMFHSFSFPVLSYTISPQRPSKRS